MQPLVQSAFDAANRGESNKAIELLKQALAADPNDVDAWLVLAAVIEQPERKRQCLNRVLSLDPTNQIAREELLEMDRAAMGGRPVAVTEAPLRPTYTSQPESSNYPASTSAFEPEPASEAAYQSPFSEYPDNPSVFESAPLAAEAAPIAPETEAKPAPSKSRKEKPQVFRYPLFWRIFMFVGAIFFACIGLFAAVEDILYTLAFFIFALGCGFVGVLYLATVEITEVGIRASNVFGSSAVKWKDIQSIKSGGMRQALELVKGNGQIVKVSNQVSDYSHIVEIIRQKRPDLFGMGAPASQLSIAPGFDQAAAGAVAPAAFSGAKKFQKGFFTRYGLYLIIIPLFLFAVAAALTEPENRIGASIVAVICFFSMFIPLFQVHAIKVEPNRLTIETLFEEKVLSARQIGDIRIESRRGRYGTVINFVTITPVQGKKYSLVGFPNGEEIMYGYLTNWWNAYRNR